MPNPLKNDKPQPNDELKPCPFCGGKIRTHNPQNFISGLGHVWCDKCGAGFTGVGISGITAGHFNTRPTAERGIDEEKLVKIIGEAIGEASLCWEPKPKGVFDSHYASAIITRTVLSLKATIESGELWKD